MSAKVVPMRGVQMVMIPRTQFEVQVEQLRMRVAELTNEVVRMKNDAEAYRVMANNSNSTAHGMNVGSYVTACEYADRVANRVRMLKVTTENVAQWLVAPSDA